MADFVAVIRRAVDGLSDNNAEMRQKVYEKARGAVRRQLESMNPRPSDELMKRQLDKLEAAIGDVEGEHAEALPAEEPVEALPPEEETVAVVEPEPELAEAEPEPAAQEVPVVKEPVAETVTEPEPEPEPEPVAEVEEPAVPEVEPAVEEEVIVSQETVAVAAHVEPSWQVEAEPAEDYVPSWHEPEHDAAVAQTADGEAHAEPEQEVYPVHDAVLPEAEPVADAHMSAPAAEWDWQEAEPVTAPADQPVEPPQDALSGDDPLAWDWPDEKVVQPAAEPAQSTPASEWGDLDDLIGFTPKASAEAAAVAPAVADAGAGTTEQARAPQRSFRAEPRKRRFGLAAIAATVAFLAVVGGAGAAYWLNRDTVNDWVGARVASLTGSAAEKPADTTKAGETAEGGRSLPASTTTGTDQAAGKSGTEVASASPSSGGKFTQRLLTDGSEVDEGPAPALEGEAEEGKSVAAQTASAEGEAAGAATTPTGGEAAATAGDTAAQTPAAGGEQATTGATQKMFLYEERLGQTSPTAIEGTVAWSTAEESPGGDAKPEPVVRGQINVPSKGLTALITFRRNVDKSLPASHIVELVFSLPENFEGGGIESVQRVAMKRTEQDRGDALIAVPAKITDDFHMIALNDFPEAIAKNTELLRTRNWIDIPITYRNGRRALLTLDKGKAGAEAFDKVMKSWASLGTGAGSSQ